MAVGRHRRHKARRPQKNQSKHVALRRHKALKPHGARPKRRI